MILLKNVSKTYETGTRVIKDLNLSIKDGEFVFIVGKSGAGKSTLFRLLTREIKPDSGEIIVNDRNLSKLRQRDIPRYRRTLGVVFQDFRLLNDRNVFDNVAFAQQIIGADRYEIKKNVTEMLKLTGLSAKYKNMPFQLSGGEQQRAAIARALVNSPSVILADEPTGNLDKANSIEIMRLLEKINRMGTTVVVITHSEELVRSMHKRVIRMDRGEVSSDEEWYYDDDYDESESIIDNAGDRRDNKELFQKGFEENISKATDSSVDNTETYRQRAGSIETDLEIQRNSDNNHRNTANTGRGRSRRRV